MFEEEETQSLSEPIHREDNSPKSQFNPEKGQDTQLSGTSEDSSDPPPLLIVAGVKLLLNVGAGAVTVNVAVAAAAVSRLLDNSPDVLL